MTEKGDLEQFIFESVTQIAAGISSAQGPIGALGGRVNPIGSIAPLEGMAIVHVPGDRMGYVQRIEFDIAVTRETGESSGVGGGLKVVGISVGGKSEEQSNNSSVSRLRFTLPILMPGQPDTETEKELVERQRQENEAMRRYNQGYAG